MEGVDGPAAKVHALLHPFLDWVWQGPPLTSPEERGPTAPKETSLVNRHSSLIGGGVRQLSSG